MRRLCAVVVLLSFAVIGCQPSSRPATLAKADRVYLTEWMDALYGLVRVERYSPPVVARAFSYSSVAFYEAMRPAMPGYQSLAGQLTGLDALPEPEADASYDWVSVAVATQQQVAQYLFASASTPSQVQIEQLAEAQLAGRLDEGVTPAVQARSVAYGQTLADALIDWMQQDRFHETREEPYELAYAGPESWVPTATAANNVPLMASPATDFVSLDTDASRTSGLTPELVSERMLLVNRPDSWLNPHKPLEPHWGTLRPLVMREASQCQPPPPPAYSEEPDSKFYEEVEAVYETFQMIGPEEITIARFWSDCPGQTGTPPGHWVQIMSQLVEQLDLSPERAVEMYAFVGIGLQDAFISCWDEKYRSMLVRPVTYIQNNIDPSFQTVVVTPPFPEYTSGHSVVSGAAATLLTHLFGEVTFTDRTHAWLGFEDRTFDSFMEAAEEAAISRLYGGIHYPQAIDLGVEQGACVADQIIQTIQLRR